MLYSCAMQISDSSSASPTSAVAQQNREKLDAWVREVVAWHFDPATGCPFWLDFAKKLDWDPRREIQKFDDLKRFGLFEDEWLRGGPVQRWIPKGMAGKPVYVFETGGTTGTPKTRINCEDFRIDYELFSNTLSGEFSLAAGTGSCSDRRGRDVSALPSNTSHRCAAAFASAWISILGGWSS